MMLARGLSCIAFLSSLPRVAPATDVFDDHALHPVKFYAMGDAPYSNTEKLNLPKQIEKLKKQDADFAIHLGDMQDRTSQCGRTPYMELGNVLLKKSELPMFIIPGDNDYYDCANWQNAFRHWNSTFHAFDDNWKDVRPFRVSRQAAQPENFYFVYQNVLFLGIHTLWTRRVKNQGEWNRIENNNRDWTRNRFEQWGDRVDAVVIFSHSYTRKELYPKYWEALSSYGEAHPDIPILFLQGDAHRFRQDTPFRAKNILRTIVDRGGIADPVLVTVDPGASQPFHFEHRGLTGM